MVSRQFRGQLAFVAAAGGSAFQGGAASQVGGSILEQLRDFGPLLGKQADAVRDLGFAERRQAGAEDANLLQLDPLGFLKVNESKAFGFRDERLHLRRAFLGGEIFQL